MKEKSKKKNLFLFISVIVLIIVGGIAYLVVKDLKQEDLLKQEIINLSNRDLLTDDYRIEVKTTGDYAYIEEAIKKFYKELSDSVKILNNSMNDEEIIQILSADNLQEDRPHFEKSYRVLENARANSTDALKKIASMCDEEAIKSLIDPEKVDDYYMELYQKLMYTEEDLKKFQETKLVMETLTENINIFLDKVKEILNMLEENNEFWIIENGQLYFTEDSLVDEYNTLYEELKTISSEKFTSGEDTTTSKTTDSI